MSKFLLFVLCFSWGLGELLLNIFGTFVFGIILIVCLIIIATDRGNNRHA